MAVHGPIRPSLSPTRPPMPQNLMKRFGCGFRTIVGQLNDKTWVIARHFCKAYKCPRCSKGKFQKARQQLGLLASGAGLTKFWTLTLDPKTARCDLKNPAKSIAWLRQIWRSMRMELARYYEKHGGTGAMPFIQVVELHKNGAPHLHVLLPIFIQHAWMKRAWQAVGGGQMVWVEPVDVHRVKAYLTKYITKERLSNIPDGTRRFTLSKGMVLWPKRKASGFYLCGSHIEVLKAENADAREKWEIVNGELLMIGLSLNHPPRHAYPASKPFSCTRLKKSLLKHGDGLSTIVTEFRASLIYGKDGFAHA